MFIGASVLSSCAGPSVGASTRGVFDPDQALPASTMTAPSAMRLIRISRRGPTRSPRMNQPIRAANTVMYVNVISHKTFEVMMYDALRCFLGPTHGFPVLLDFCRRPTRLTLLQTCRPKKIIAISKKVSD